MKDAAVEPLLARIEGDTRLSRWPRSEAAFPVTVHDLALDALWEAVADSLPDRLLPQREPEFERVGETRADEAMQWRLLAGDIRAYLAKLKGLPPPERWYRALADDREPSLWLAAARKIVSDPDMPPEWDVPPSLDPLIRAHQRFEANRCGRRPIPP